MDKKFESGEISEEILNLRRELETQRQIGYATGLFQEDITIHALMESLCQGVIIINHQGAILLINKAAESIFGFSREEVIGKAHDILLPVRFQSIHHQHMAEYVKNPKTRPMGIGMELFGRRKDGSDVPVEIGLSFIETKHVKLIMAVVSDITQRKNDEQAIQKGMKELAELNKELESFSYSVAHDFRKYLNAIKITEELLAEEKSVQLDEEGKGYLKRIASNVGMLSLLIEDLLTLSKLSRQELKFETINLSEMALSIITELEKNDPKREVESIIKSNLHTSADAGLMILALNNLLGNAWKFTSKSENPKIEFGVLNQGSQRVFFIRDNGAGFDQEKSGKMFTPFHRLHTDQEFPGTGVGLSIVDRIIQRHGGKLWAEGQPGKGATFFFTIP